MIRATTAAMLLIGLLAGGGPWLDLAGDLILDRVPVPSADRPQAEVRIVRRKGRPVVQTLLYTRVLKRVIGAIADKERHGWPEGAAGHAAAQRYAAALDDFQRTALARRDATGSQTDRRVQGLIEFVDEPGHPFVAIGGAVIESSKDGMRLISRTAPVVLELSSDYVQRNMRLIVADSFHITPEEAATRLARAVAK